MDRSDAPLYFQFFNEIGIIGQLSRTMLEAELPKGLLAPHFSILNHAVRVKDGQTPLALAKAFQVPKTTMTHSLGVLERHGLIELKPHPKDGRSKQVWITPAGRSLREGVVEATGPAFAAFAERFDPEVMQDVVPKLAEMRAFLDAARDED